MNEDQVDAVVSAFRDAGYRVDGCDEGALFFSKPAPVPPMHQAVRFTYTNWRGETRERRVMPQWVWFGATDWHKTPQWLLKATDLETGEERDFAMRDIRDWRPAEDD